MGTPSTRWGGFLRDKVALTMAEGERTVVENRRARHTYALDEGFEAGLALQGAKVKALREGKGQIAEAYATIRDGEVFLLNMHISPYSGASTHVEVDPIRPRKLLLHRKEDR